MMPFAWQKADQLVYCNYLEHLLLHLKIGICRQKYLFHTPKEVLDFFTTGGYWQITCDINDLYAANTDQKSGWKKACYEQIAENYDDYIDIHKIALAYLFSKYIGKREPAILSEGYRFPMKRRNKEAAIVDIRGCTLVSINKDYSKMRIKSKEGVEYDFPLAYAYYQCGIDDIAEIIKTNMAKSHKTENDISIIYEDIKHLISSGCSTPNIVGSAEKLNVDFRGFGFPQFTNIPLDDMVYGRKTVDEYIGKAFPTKVNVTYQIGNDIPIFWQGDIPLKAQQSKFYIIRVEAVFEIKKGQTPFVRFKEPTLLWPGARSAKPSLCIDDENNFLYKNGIVLEHSYIWSEADNRYYDAYYEGRHLRPASVVISFTRDDFELFKKTYKVKQLKILDGCYFE